MSSVVEAPAELLLVGDPKMGCDAWQNVDRVEVSWPTGIEAGLVTEAVRYVRADAAWVSVKERLPKGRGTVLVHIAPPGSYRGELPEIVTTWFDPGFHWEEEGEERTVPPTWSHPRELFITHWAPLPTPPLLETPAAALPTTGEGAAPSLFVFEGHPNATQQQAIKQAEPQVGTIWCRKHDKEQVIICESTRWDSVAFRRHPAFSNSDFNRLRYKKTHYFLAEYELAPTTGEGKEGRNDG